MSTLDLIGRVAVRRIRESTPPGGGRSFLCIMGLAKPVVSAIARHIAGDAPAPGEVEVFVHPSLVDGDVSPATVSDVPAPYRRNHVTPGIRLTVCTVPPELVKDLEPTLEHKAKIGEAWLLQEPAAWAVEGMPRSSQEIRQAFATVIGGLLKSRVAHDPVTVAEFVERVNEHVVNDGETLEKAVRGAMPVLRLSKNGGDRRSKVSESIDNAARFFADAFAEAQPALYLKGKDGEPLNRNEMKRRLDAFVKENNIAPGVVTAIRDVLLDKTIQDGRWSATQRALAEFPADDIAPFFEGAKRKTKPKFGEETKTFFDQQFRGALSPENEALLNDLSKETAKPSEQLVDFFTEHRARLQTSPSLYKRWERLIFRAPIEAIDLLEGLLRLSYRAASEVDDDGGPQGRVLLIRLRGSEQLGFWTTEKNTRVLLHLRDRYRGLDKMLAPHAVLDCGRCWSEDWVRGVAEENESPSKAAVELEFEAFLVPAGEVESAKKNVTGKPHAHRAQMTWRPPAEAIGLSLSVDLRFIRPRDPSKPTRLLTGRVHHNRSRSAAAVAAVSLADRTSILDAFGQSGGVLANPDRLDNRIDERWPAALAEIEKDGILAPRQVDRLREAFGKFYSVYGAAVDALLFGEGLASPKLLQQAGAFGELLDELAGTAPQEACIRALMAPLTSIGVIAIDGERPAAIVTAWQPLRLAEMAIKAKQLVLAVHQVIASTSDQKGGVEDYVKDRANRLVGTYYADVAIVPLPSQSHALLSETQALADCSLLEVGAGAGQPSLSDEPAEAVVTAFDKVGDKYLALRPHEKANFSVIILNAESENLPLAMANGLAKRIENDPDIRCDLVVTDDEPLRLRQVYERQNRRIASQVDAGLTSEATRSFLSRLRVGIFSPDTIERDSGRKAHDIVLLQDVISRRGQVRWTKGEASADAPDLETYLPTARSKRRPFKKGNTTTALYLTAPRQPVACRSYVDALRHVLQRDVVINPEPWLPIQDVEFQSGEVRDLLVKAHSLGNWVMTFDRVADKRLIATNERRIITYYSVPGSTHNVIVSTEIEQASLAGCLAADLENILPNASNAILDGVKREIFTRAAHLSGGVVMRGAQWSNYAQELLGLILTQRELGRLLTAERKDGDNKTGWFFLDDYRDYLDLTGEMADILAIDFAIGSSGPEIRVVVAESKYASQGAIHDHRRRSWSQLESTFTALNLRLLTDGSTLDPSIWRNRLADMVLEHMEPFDHVGGIQQQDWLEALRTGTFPIEVSGHSMVFSHDLDAVHDEMPVIADADKPKSERRRLAQWVFSRSQTAEALLRLGDEAKPGLLSVPSGWPSPVASTAPTSDEPSPPPAALDVPTALASTHNDDPATMEAVTSLAQASTLSALQPETGLTVETRDSGWHPSVAGVLARLSRVEGVRDDDEWLNDTIDRLRKALQTEGMDAPILGSRLTPNTGLVYVGGQTLTVAWLERKQTDLMTRYGLQIDRITPMPGRIAIGLRRPSRTILHLAAAWLHRDLPADAGAAQRFAPLLGEKEDDGSLCFLPLAADFAGQERAAPHSLVSGTTGSGKGILVTNLILDLCALNGPQDVELHLIDPKRGVDYAWARRLPHLKGGIVEDQDSARALLDRLVEEMEARYELIAAQSCRNVDQYNRKVTPDHRLPRVVIFFDEVANWMQDDDFKAAVDAAVNKIATKSRAAGFHLFMIYQRADNQVMSMQLRTNLGNKLILRLGDEGSSKIALNEKGAERLLGKGHLIAKLDTDDKVYLQVPYIGDDEVEELADAIVSSWSNRDREAAE